MDQLENRVASGLRLTEAHWETIRGEASRLAPEEACGLLAGTPHGVEAVIPVTNTLHSPVRFRMEPMEQLKAFQQIEERAFDLLGIYHSHPLGPGQPSPTDIREAYYPEAVALIVALIDGDWRCRGFVIQEGAVREVPVLIAG